MNAPIQSPNGQSSAHPSMASSTASTMNRQSPSNTAAAGAQPAPAGGQTPSTDVFLRDFTLVAEAAKRAQMAVMMRDFESVGLS